MFLAILVRYSVSSWGVPFEAEMLRLCFRGFVCLGFMTVQPLN